MKINFMGTAAYERIPSIFCNCPACEYARKHKGKNIRTQTQTLINDDLLIDFGMDNYYHDIKSGFKFSKVQNILITHSHEDHFALEELRMRDESGSKNVFCENLNIYGGVGSQELFDSKTTHKCTFNLMEKFVPYNVGKYKVIAFPARHGTIDPLTYLISDGQKTIYYCLDSWYPNEEVYEFIKEKAIKIDLVICDCTYSIRDIEDDGGHHMSLKNNFVHRERLINAGAINQNTTWVVTHFTHNSMHKDGKAVSFRELNKICKKNKMKLAYDGYILNV